MVFPGKFSTGCHQCRRRGIKCDEEKPGCKRCAIYGKPCPGYRELSVIFCKEEQFLHRSSAGKVVKNSKKPLTFSDACATSVLEFPKLARPNSSRCTVGSDGPWLFDQSSISEVPSPCYAKESVYYFFNQFTLSATSAGPGYLEWLPELYDECAKGSPLKLAVAATAYSIFANRTGQLTLLTKARQSYGAALRQVSEALKTIDEAIKDETLAAVLILSMFEVISGERAGLTSPHNIGFDILLRLRGHHQTDTPRGKSLFRHVHTQMQLQSLGLSKEPNPIAVHYLRYYIKNLSRSLPGIILRAIVFRINQLCSFVMKALASENTSIECLSTLFDEGTGLDMELSEFVQGLPAIWKYRNVKLSLHSPPCRLRHVYPKGLPDPTHGYSDSFVAAIWNCCRMVRIVLQKALLDIHLRLNQNLVDPDSSPSISKLQSHYDIINTQISDILASIPFCLGDIDIYGNWTQDSTTSDNPYPCMALKGYFMTWPLWLVSSHKLATAEQKAVAKSSLRRIASVTGIRLALVFAEKEDALSEEHKWITSKG